MARTRGLLLASLLLSHACTVRAIIHRKAPGVYVEDEPRRNYQLEDFLWSGSGDGSGDRPATWATTTVFRTTTVLTTVYPTPVFPTASCSPGHVADCIDLSPTPTLFQGHPAPTLTLQPPTPSPVYPDLPDQKYWLVTVLEANGTSAQLSPAIFEQRLARLYRTAFHRQQEKHLKLLNGNRTKKTVGREHREAVSVKLHRVRRSMEGSRLELVYTVRLAGRPVDPGVASQDLRLLDAHEVATLLGFNVLTRAERIIDWSPWYYNIPPKPLSNPTSLSNKQGKRKAYLKTAEPVVEAERDGWLILGGSVAAGLLLLGLLLGALFWAAYKKSSPRSLVTRSPGAFLPTEKFGRDNMSFRDDMDGPRVAESGGDEEARRDDQEEDGEGRRKTDGAPGEPSPRTDGKRGLTPRPRPRSYKPSTPNSYLSMPSVKAFPRGASKPGPLEEVLEGGRAVSRHSSDSADPGVLGPLVWDLHCHRLTKQESGEGSPNPEMSVGRMRRRFHELLDDAFSLFGSGSASPEHSDSASAHNYGRAKSAVVLPVDPLTSETVLRPKTTDASVRPSTATGGLRCGVPRGAWDGTPSPLPQPPPAGSAPLRPLSAGPLHAPSLEPAWILSDSSLRPTDPAVPLIRAIKSELDKFPQTGSYQT